MTLGTLILAIAAIAVVLTLVVGFVFRKVDNWLLSYLQTFTGALFIFSGWVKAVDPLGTAFKMEQYFAEFESVFETSWMSFLAPLFPWLGEYAVSFSVFMIVFEIVLGLMLLLGIGRKFTSRAFLVLLAFFTFLTGFTFLTAYVPDGVNFFQFAKWGPYVETNMKVTDCGCFGDFLKLEPKVSFMKDVVLLVPALLFVFYWKKMHQLFSKGSRMAIIGIAIVGLTFYCLSNYSWALPHADFRPFKEGVNIAERKAMEEEAENNIRIIAYRMTNKQTKEVVELPYDQYLKEYKKYPKEEWKLEQLKTEPEVPRTKISDFEAMDAAGNDVSAEILADSNFSFMVIAYKLYGIESRATEIVMDTIFRTDTVRITGTDSIEVVRKVDAIEKRQLSKEVYDWQADYTKPWKEVVNPVMEEAEKAGFKVFAIAVLASQPMLDDFRHATQSAYPFYTADGLLLKTIIRSNPGVVLLKNGEVIKKWHYKRLPSFEKIKTKYLKF